jgi:hypothetical protein
VKNKLLLQLDGAHIIYGMMSFYHSFEVIQRFSDLKVDYIRVGIKTCSPCAKNFEPRLCKYHILRNLDTLAKKKKPIFERRRLFIR